MVYCGKPSRACQRCRTRRLKCDLRNGACGQCERANIPCSGYRDTQQLRVRIESRSIARKAQKTPRRFEPPWLPLSVDYQAREAFFAYYATGTARCWSFLRHYHRSTDSPRHLSLAIEAVSMAYFWHQVQSDVALVAARQRYVLALRVLNESLNAAAELSKPTTMVTLLLLDLFEKIANYNPSDSKSWTSHVNGSIALVEIRGLGQFRDPFELHLLARLSAGCLTSCVVKRSPVPDALNAIQAHVRNPTSTSNPMDRITSLTIQYANLNSRMEKRDCDSDECIKASLELDASIQALELDLPENWRFSSVYLTRPSARALGHRFDLYSHRNICQARNMLRIMRIQLNEHLIEHYSAVSASTAKENYSSFREASSHTIETLTREICACAPQRTDCDNAARHRLPASEKPKPPPRARKSDIDTVALPKWHSHTPDHLADCYSLIFPLYAAARTKTARGVRSWIVSELHYIGGHFNIRNAEVVAQMLDSGADVSPWEVYAMLGSYAFTA